MGCQMQGGTYCAAHQPTSWGWGLHGRGAVGVCGRGAVGMCGVYLYGGGVRGQGLEGRCRGSRLC
jgi:hypothetical protein